MKNRKIAVFLAVCLGTVFFSGCGSDMKNYRQASSDLEAEKYDEALQEFETAIAAGVMCILEIIKRPLRILRMP